MATLYTYITGPNGSGKSQFLYSLGDPDGWEKDDSTGIETRHLVIDDSLEVYVFCSIEATRFDPLLNIPSRDLLGYILMVDSTTPDTWESAKLMAINCRNYALLPTIVVANKQDLPGAHSPEEVAEAIGLETMFSVVGCTATDVSSARSIFLELLYSVNQEIERLDELIAELERLAAEGKDRREE